jgi:Site-specific recombinases, DNA invertase Pin homologs
MKIAYVRVSTSEQNTERQFAALKEIGVDKYYEEKLSGKDTNRPELQEMLSYVRDGDVVYVESISRLGRNLKDLIDIVEMLDKKNVGLISLKESHIDTTTPTGKLIFQIFASLSEFERNQMKQRQSEGIKIAKEKGKYKGRKKVEIKAEFSEVYDDWKSEKTTAVEAMKKLKMTKSTFYRRVKEWEEKIAG